MGHWSDKYFLHKQSALDFPKHINYGNGKIARPLIRTDEISFLYMAMQATVCTLVCVLLLRIYKDAYRGKISSPSDDLRNGNIFLLLRAPGGKIAFL